jgi:hypothetical protein
LVRGRPGHTPTKAGKTARNEGLQAVVVVSPQKTGKQRKIPPPGLVLPASASSAYLGCLLSLSLCCCALPSSFFSATQRPRRQPSRRGESLAPPKAQLPGPVGVAKLFLPRGHRYLMPARRLVPLCVMPARTSKPWCVCVCVCVWPIPKQWATRKRAGTLGTSRLLHLAAAKPLAHRGGGLQPESSRRTCLWSGFRLICLQP